MITYNLAKNILENVLEYLDKKNFTEAYKELLKLKTLFKNTIDNILTILKFLETNNIKIKRDIYNFIYYYLKDFVLSDEDALFIEITEYKNKEEIFIKSKLFSIKGKLTNRFKKEIEEIDNYLEILYLIFRFLDFKLRKCGIEIKFYEIESKFLGLKKQLTK